MNQREQLGRSNSKGRGANLEGKAPRPPRPRELVRVAKPCPALRVVEHRWVAKLIGAWAQIKLQIPGRVGAQRPFLTGKPGTAR
jgi:hypothetical protein